MREHIERVQPNLLDEQRIARLFLYDIEETIAAGHLLCRACMEQRLLEIIPIRRLYTRIADEALVRFLSRRAVTLPVNARL